MSENQRKVIIIIVIDIFLHTWALNIATVSSRPAQEPRLVTVSYTHHCNNHVDNHNHDDHCHRYDDNHTDHHHTDDGPHDNCHHKTAMVIIVIMIIIIVIMIIIMMRMILKL